MSDTPRTDDQIGHNGNTMTFINIVFARQLERELAASQAGQAELLARLEEARTSHLHAAARDVQTIQQQAVELAKWQALAEGLATAIQERDYWAHTMHPAEAQTEEALKAALSAYEAAKSANHD